MGENEFANVVVACAVHLQQDLGSKTGSGENFRFGARLGSQSPTNDKKSMKHGITRSLQGAL
jgi:hypothetical protein